MIAGIAARNFGCEVLIVFKRNQEAFVLRQGLLELKQEVSAFQTLFADVGASYFVLVAMAVGFPARTVGGWTLAPEQCLLALNRKV